jgi:uncharacterized protein YgiM (DUF1202 family)
MKSKKINVWVYILCFVLGIITAIIIDNVICKINNKKLKESIIYEIEIKEEYINLRPEIDLNSKIIKKVYKGQKYQVVEYYEGNVYNWYKIIYDDNKTGWIASNKDNSWVTIISEEE